MTNYYINEAILSFSGNISQDSTLNMIRLSDPDAALIISRGKMQDGDVDFSLPGHFPLEWQRTYSSRDERTEGMFGRGWSVLYEVCLERTPDNPDENCMTYVAPMGRRIDLQAVEPGSGFYSPGEGLAVRRSEQGHWLISSDDGVYSLFEADPFSPQRRRLKMLGDRNSNCQHLTYDNHGRLVEISGDRQRPCIRLHYELAAHPQRVTRIFRHHPEGEPELLRRYRYDEAGRLNGVVDNAGQYQREFAYDDNDCMTMHREPGGERYYYTWAWFEGPDDAAWRVTGHHTDSGEQYRLDWNLAERSLCVTDKVLYYHTDVNGAPEEMTDGGGNIVWEAGYQVWGNLTHEKETRPVQQNLRFQGQYLDRETGLHYNLYRFYDSDTGKFISGDPIGLKGGLNQYAYAPNPLTYIDPLGLKCGFAEKNNITQRWVNKLTGKTPAEIDSLLTSKGWTKIYPQAGRPDAIQHIQYVKTTKSGTTYKLDYHPGGNAKQPNIHGNDYWKVYRANSKGEDIVYGRIGHGGFENYDLIKDSPVYVDGVLVNGGM